MRTLLIALLAVVVVAIGADFGTAAYAEYHLSRSIRQGADLQADPEVTISGFPFLTQLAHGHYDKVTVRADGVPTEDVGKVSLLATLQGVHLPASQLLGGLTQPIVADHVDGQMGIEQTALGQFLGVPDLEVAAAPAPTDASTSAAADTDKTEGTDLDSSTGTGSGANAGTDKDPDAETVRLTGTVGVGAERTRVSILARLTLTDGNVKLTATGLTTSSDDNKPVSEVAGTDRTTVLSLFTKTLSRQDLPFGIRPTRIEVDGSEIIVHGAGDHVRLSVDSLQPWRTGRS